MWSWVSRLARDHEVALVGFYERESEAGGAEEIARRCVETRVRLRCPTPHGYVSFAQLPRPVTEFFSEELAADVASAVRSFRPDVVQFLASHMTQYRRRVGETPSVVTALDIAFVAHRRAIIARRGLARLQARCEWLRMLRYEAAAFRRADHVIAVSDHEADIVRAVARHGRVTAVPPGVDREDLAPRARHPEPGGVLYLGHMEHYPNLDGLLFLYREIWAHVRHAYPKAKLTVAGGRTREELAREDPEMLARMERDPSVELLGFVPDLRALMDATGAMAAIRRESSAPTRKATLRRRARAAASSARAGRACASTGPARASPCRTTYRTTRPTRRRRRAAAANTVTVA
jgi:glycosyltransferase involved in cell wall biosynthesis